MVRAGKAVVMLHMTLRANVLYAATIGLPASNSIVDEIAEDDAENVVFIVCITIESDLMVLLVSIPKDISINQIERKSSAELDIVF